VFFWSRIWYEKLIFLKIIFKENIIIYPKNVIWIYTVYLARTVARKSLIGGLYVCAGGIDIQI